MRLIVKLALVSLLAAVLPLQTWAKDNKEQPIYAFGFSANFNDTLLFVTPIQVIAGAHFDKKEGGLEHLELYSQQLKNYLESNYLGHETCAVFVSKNKKKLVKKHAKVLKNLAKEKHSKLIELTAEEFQFKPVVLPKEEDHEDEQQK